MLLLFFMLIICDILICRDDFFLRSVLITNSNILFISEIIKHNIIMFTSYRAFYKMVKNNQTIYVPKCVAKFYFEFSNYL